MGDLYKKAENDVAVLSIFHDEDAENPREWDNIGTMVCWHSRYKLGDKHDYSNVDEFLHIIAEELGIDVEVEGKDGESDYRDSNDLLQDIEKKIIILPLYLYDHSGITISTSAFSCQWDSGQVGYIYATNSAIIKEYGVVTEETKKTTLDYLQGEVKTYDDFLRGNVYGFQLKKKVKCECCGHTELDDIDSCWGFYGDDVIAQVKDTLSEEYRDLVDKL